MRSRRPASANGRGTMACSFSPAASQRALMAVIIALRTMTTWTGRLLAGFRRGKQGVVERHVGGRVGHFLGRLKADDDRLFMRRHEGDRGFLDDDPVASQREQHRRRRDAGLGERVLEHFAEHRRRLGGQVLGQGQSQRCFDTGLALACARAEHIQLRRVPINREKTRHFASPEPLFRQDGSVTRLPRTGHRPVLQARHYSGSFVRPNSDQSR